MPFGLRRLLLALALPALLLPDGVTLCLCRLVGERLVRASCERCCCHDGDDRADAASTAAPSHERLPSVRGRTDCWLTTPPATRTAAAGAQSPAAESLALALASSHVALAPVFIDDSHAPFAVSVVARTARTLHPPPIVPLALPLRL